MHPLTDVRWGVLICAAVVIYNLCHAADLADNTNDGVQDDVESDNTQAICFEPYGQENTGL